MNDTKVVRYKVISTFIGVYGTRMPILGVQDGEEIPVNTELVTHADYRALEEDRDMWFTDHGIIESQLREAREELRLLRKSSTLQVSINVDLLTQRDQLTDELASLRARVGELVAGVDEFYACDIYIEGAEGADDRLIAARKAFP